MATGFGFRENVRRFLRYECSPEEQDAFYQETRAIRQSATRHVTQSGLVPPARLVDELKKKGEFAVLGSFNFVSCRAIYAYYPRRDTIEVLECWRIKPQKTNDKDRGGA